MSRFPVVKYLLVTLGLAICGALTSCLGVQIYGSYRLQSAIERLEQEDPAFRPPGVPQPRLPDDKNAVTWLQPGTLAVVLFPPDKALIRTLAEKPPLEWTAPERSQVEVFLDRNAPAIEILRRARGMARSDWHIAHGGGSTTKLPNLLAVVDAAKLLGAHGRLALAQGDRETALEDVETLGVLARSLQAEPETIVLLIGVATERIQLGLVRDVGTTSADPRELARLEASLCNEELEPAFRRAFRMSASAIAREIASDEIMFDIPRWIPRRFVAGLASLAAAQVIENDLGRSSPLGGRIRAPIAATKPNANRWWGSQLMGSIGPNMRNTVSRGTATASARALARVALSVRREALASGAYPASIPATVDPLSGEPFVYAVDASGGAEVRSTTTLPILKSIYAAGVPAYFDLYRWTLPVASRSSTPSPSPAGPRAGSS